jgi:hypothetical protein
MKRLMLLYALVLYWLGTFAFTTIGDDPVTAFTQSLAEKVAQSESQQKTVIQGKDGWLFFVPELRCLSVGQFWGDVAAKVSRASKPEHADPCIGERAGESLTPVKTWRDNPVVLLGDSHDLVSHIGGDMHAVGAVMKARIIGKAIDPI